MRKRKTMKKEAGCWFQVIQQFEVRAPNAGKNEYTNMRWVELNVGDIFTVLDEKQDVDIGHVVKLILHPEHGCCRRVTPLGGFQTEAWDEHVRLLSLPSS